MREQIDTTSSHTESEYSKSSPASSLGLLLHQFFLDRIAHCVQAKHGHLLRWRRFAEHSSSIEDAYPAFKSRLAYIMSEFADCRERAARLSQARDVLLSFGSLSNPQALVSTMNVEDVEIYTRWLVAHTYSLKSFLNAMKVVEWAGFMMSIEARASGGALEDIYGVDDYDEDDIEKQQATSTLLIGADESSFVS